MSIADRVGELVADGPGYARSRRSPMETPSKEIHGDHGTLVSRPTTDNHPDWDMMFAFWNLDPNEWIVDEGSLKVNSWEMPGPDGELRIHHQYKANIRRRPEHSLELKDLLDQIKTRKRPKVLDKPGEGAAFIVNCTDWQIGGEGGTPAAKARILSALDEVEVEAKAAVKQGATMCVLASVGDIVEGVEGSYKSQTFTVDLDLSGQVRVARQLLMEYLKRLVPLFPEFKVAAVRGNHGQKSQLTTPEDNADLDYVEGVMEVCKESEWGKHITWHFPEWGIQSQVMIDAAGTYILFAHGDEKRGKVDAMETWWEKASFNRHADADLASILILGHRHHLQVRETAINRWLIQCPAMDGGSRWYADSGGGTSKPGVLTFITQNDRWWGMNIAEPTEGITDARVARSDGSDR